MSTLNKKMSYFATENVFLPTVSCVISVTKLYDIIYIFTSNTVNDIEIFECDENFILGEYLYLQMDPNSGSGDDGCYHNLKNYKITPHR